VTGLVGAGVGLANQPSSAPTGVSEFVGATQAAGTARFTYSSVTTSSDPLLRSASFGDGTVDFTNDSVTNVERITSTSISQDGDAPPRRTIQTFLNDETWIGRTVYTQLGIESPQVAIPWIKSKSPTGSFGSLGVLDEVEPVGILDSDLGTHGTKVELLRSEELGGTAATKYRVVVPTCTATSRSSGPRVVIGPIDLWLDSGSRLVQVRDVLHTTDSVGSFARGSTIINTIRLFDFGAPVTISAPKALLPPGQGSVAFLTISPGGCPR
jgi:hypothetical protein